LQKANAYVGFAAIPRRPTRHFSANANRSYYDIDMTIPTPPPTPPGHPPNPAPTAVLHLHAPPGPQYRSEDLLGTGDEALIMHAGQVYRLRRTGTGKLILTK
jgi:hemin uptake protein HemP